MVVPRPAAAPPSPNRPSPAPTRRRRRLLRLQQEMAALRGQLTGIRDETGRLAAVEATRSFTSAERRRVAQLKLHAEGVRLELQRLREAVAETLREGRAGDA
jgi:hypothetical protein